MFSKIIKKETQHVAYFKIHTTIYGRSTKGMIMKQIFIVLVFMACALIESPEDYAWIDSDRTIEAAAEFSSEKEFVSHDETDFRYNVEHDHAEDKLNDHENLVLSF